MLCEFVWVLTRFYKLPQMDTLAAIETLLQTRTARVDAPDLVRQTIDRTRATGGDFADILILAINREAGCSATATFDRQLAAMPGGRGLGL